jgi:hypothetical protein
MLQINQLAADLSKVETELEHLSHTYADFYKNYTGELFAEQSALATDKLDNLILQATHEVASQIGFCRQTIVDLCHLIDFRKSYHFLTDAELSLIIDKADLSASEKLILLKKCTDSGNLQSIKMQWNQLFNNKSYAQVKTNLKI